MTLSLRELNRYERQIALPDFGISGQLILKSKSILCVGMGGLGCPASLYLSAAGVGRIGLLDFDELEESNLHRQVLYAGEDVGIQKAHLAKKRLETVNAEIKIEALPFALTRENALELLETYDLVIEGTDNFEAKYLVNEAALAAGIPLISASVHQFNGLIGVFNFKGSPCFQCLFPEPPSDEFGQNCNDGGVLGAVTGVIGSLQAVEAIKLLTGIGDPCIGQVLIYDAIACAFAKYSYTGNPDCKACIASRTPSDLVPEVEPLKDVSKTVGISAREFKALLSGKEVRQSNFVILDVRTNEEAETTVSIPGSVLIPVKEILEMTSKAELYGRLGISMPGTANDLLYVYCKSGKRSAIAQMHLKNLGIETRTITGGIDSWMKL